jgi:hypothetical protein
MFNFGVQECAGYNRKTEIGVRDRTVQFGTSMYDVYTVDLGWEISITTVLYSAYVKFW